MAETAKKESLPVRVNKGIKATKSELKKVVLPTRKQLVNNTLIVIVAILIVGAVIFGLDSLFAFIANLVLGR